jgi:hypothetical protein
MSTDTPPADGPATNEALAADLIGLRNALTTPEAVGRALTYFVLTETVRRGKQIDANTIELPMTITTTIDRPATHSDSSHSTTTETCVHHAISLFGHEVVGWSECHTTHGSGSVHMG